MQLLADICYWLNCNLCLTRLTANWIKTGWETTGCDCRAGASFQQRLGHVESTPPVKKKKGGGSSVATSSALAVYDEANVAEQTKYPAGIQINHGAPSCVT